MAKYDWPENPKERSWGKASQGWTAPQRRVAGPSILRT